jgi:predicted DNA-binding transcriptional regulator YafY
VASDQVTIALGILAVAGPLVVTGLNQWNQAKREKEMRAHELEQEKIRQEHELHRDRQAKQYEFNLQEYRERHEACMSLLAATQHFATMATARHMAREALKKPRSAETLGAAAESAGRKIAGVLPERLRGEVRALQEAIQFVVPSKPGPADEAGLLQLLRRAIIERRGVRFRYFARHGASEAGEAAAREVDPYSLAHVAGIWYLTAYDHLRRAVRTFRLGRMEDVSLLDRTFMRPPGFRLRPRNPEVEAAYVVRALFDAESARWVRESPSFFQVAAEEGPDGLLVTLRAREEGDVVQWLLGWGHHVRVLEPASLRRRLVEEGEALARNHRDS